MKLRLSLITATLLASASAYAVDNKAYPGGNCRPVNSSVAHAIGGSLAFVQNTSAGAASFHCPIVRDEVQGNTPMQVRIFVTDTTAAAAISCTAFSTDPTGAVIGFANTATTPAFVGDATLGGVVNPTGVAFGNTYHLTCTLPSGSRIRSYTVIENEQVD